MSRDFPQTWIDFHLGQSWVDDAIGTSPVYAADAVGGMLVGAAEDPFRYEPERHPSIEVNPFTRSWEGPRPSVSPPGSVRFPMPVAPPGYRLWRVVNGEAIFVVDSGRVKG